MKDEEHFMVEEHREENASSSVVHIGMLCATVVALLCEIINLVEVIVNRRVSFSMFALGFFVIGAFATAFYMTKSSKSRKLLICGIICLIIALAFIICWVLSLCKVIK